MRGKERPLRPWLHAATGGFALALGVLPRSLALGAAGLGVLFGWLVLPRLPLEARLRRPGERFLGGLRTYPLAVLGLVLWLPPAEAAAAWGVLAFGDAAAALVGPRLPTPAILGHRKATWSGSLAHVLLGTGAALGLGAAVAALAHASGADPSAQAPGLLRAALAAGAAALLDLVPLPPDDNIPAAAAAGGVLSATRIWS